MNHIMLDLETLGVKESAVFTSIAAVQFDPKTGEIGQKFKVNVDIDSALSAGRTIEGGTLVWWFTQRPDIAAKMFEEPDYLGSALDSFAVWLEKVAPDIHTRVLWGNSAAFDIGKLRHAYEHASQMVPWSHRNEMCYRTVKNMFPDVEHEGTDEARAHDPLYDCEKQIKRLVAIYKAAFHSMYQDTEFEDGYTQAILLLSNIKVEGVSRLVPSIKAFMENNNYTPIVATKSVEYKQAMDLIYKLAETTNPGLSKLKKEALSILGSRFAEKPKYEFEKPFTANDSRLNVNTSLNSAHGYSEGSDFKTENNEDERKEN